MRGKPYSIALRLTLLFSVVAILTFSAVGTYLYQLLVQKIELRDDARLIDKVVLVRRLLADYDSVAALEHTAAPFRNVLYGREGFALRLSAADGRLLLQVDAPAPSPPRPAMAATQVVPARQTPTLDDVANWRAAADDGRVVHATGTLGDAAGTPLLITLSRPRSSHSAFLRQYLLNLSCAIVLGAALVAVLGYLIVRQGLRPLRLVIGQANTISTHRLNSRLAAGHGPAELRELGAAFNAMLDRLEDGVQRLSRFAADLAHDLRTPVNTLMVQTQVALSQPRSNDEYQALIASNIEEYERLARLIENTLFLARVDNAQLAMARETLDAHAELMRMRAYFDGLADEAGITLGVASAAAGTARLHADPILLRRALGNLVSNAIAYTPRGGSVTLSALAGGPVLQIDISNTGPGIAVEHMPHIFDRYYRADAARSSHASAGLGLSIARAIMRLHGGDIGARSTPGVLTTFSLRFPA